MLVDIGKHHLFLLNRVKSCLTDVSCLLSSFPVYLCAKCAGTSAALENAIDSAIGTLGKSDTFGDVCQQWIAGAWLRNKQVMQCNPFNKTAGIGDGHAVIINADMHGTKASVIPVDKRVDKSLSKRMNLSGACTTELF